MGDVQNVDECLKSIGESGAMWHKTERRDGKNELGITWVIDLLLDELIRTTGTSNQTTIPLLMF